MLEMRPPDPSLRCAGVSSKLDTNKDNNRERVPLVTSIVIAVLIEDRSCWYYNVCLLRLW